MKQRDWDTLIQTIQYGDCILMLGPEIALDDEKGRPNQSLMKMLEKELSAELIDELKEKGPSVDYTYEKLRCNNINELATKYYKEIGKASLQASVVSFLKKNKNIRSQIYKNLAYLPFRFIVNTTPDEIFIENLKAWNKNPSKDFYHYEGAMKEMVGDSSAAGSDSKPGLGSPEKPFVYYLYGAIDEPKSLVISENDLLEFLVKIISKNPPLPLNILSQFKDEHKCFLFLGFRFLSRNWYFRILLHILNVGRKSSRSLALENISQLDEEKEQAIVFFDSEFKLKFPKIDLQTFVAELKRRFEQEVSKPQTVIPRPSPFHKPRVFISHTEEDTEYANKLFNLFKKNDLDPWFDKENLRGGDQWDSVTENTIKEMDAFVLLQSKSLNKKVVGYINKEITLALKRASYFRQGEVKFFFPVIIDKETKPLKMTSDYQSLKLTDESNLEKLIKEIKMSYQRRLKSRPSE